MMTFSQRVMAWWVLGQTFRSAIQQVDSSSFVMNALTRSLKSRLFMLESLTKGHVFLDGNKRTALSSMLSFLDLNDFELKVNESELEDRIVEIADGKIHCKQLAKWLAPDLHSKTD